jgi:hypothetical protein
VKGLRPFVLEDVPAALALMREALGEGRVPRSEAFFRWKHLGNPFGNSIGFVVDDEARGGLLALRLFLRWGLQENGYALGAVRAVDTATAVRAQGQGYFKRLTMMAIDTAVADDVDLVFNTPNEKSGAGYLKMGWREVGRKGVWLRAGRPSFSGRIDGDPVDVEVVARSIAAQMTEPGIRTRHTVATLRWRYVDIPGFSYRMHRVGDAVAVFRRQRRRGVPECTICELHHPATLRGVAQATKLVDELGRGFAGFVSVMTTSSTTAAALLAAGGVRLPLGPRLFVRPLAMRRVDPMPETHERFALGIGDLELF